jgi:hypothetical protein
MMVVMAYLVSTRLGCQRRQCCKGGHCSQTAYKHFRKFHSGSLLVGKSQAEKNGVGGDEQCCLPAILCISNACASSFAKVARPA